jgi:hypothetical protein
MFLSVKEMEVRKIRFDETFRAGQIDFAGEIWSRIRRCMRPARRRWCRIRRAKFAFRAL